MPAHRPDMVHRLHPPAWAANLPLRWKIGMLVVAGLIAIFGLFGVLGLSIVREETQRIIAERLTIARTSASFLDTELNEQFTEIEGAAHDLGADPQAVLEAGDLLREPEAAIISVFLLDSTGGQRWFGPSDDALLKQPEVIDGTGQLLHSRQRYVSGVYGWKATRNPVAVMAVPVFDAAADRTGVLGVVVDMSTGSFATITAGARGFARTGHAELIDQNGRVIASSEAGRVLETAEHPDFALPLLQAHTSATATTAPLRLADATQIGDRHVMAFAPLAAAPWGLSLGGTEAELSAQADHWRNQVILFGGLSLLVCLFVVGVTTRNIAHPVLALTAASRRIADGDLLTPVPHSGEGEIRALAESLDDMRTHLQQALGALAVEKSRYEGIVGSMADAVITTDLAGRITAFNPAAATLTGWSAEGAIGRSCAEVLPGFTGPAGMDGSGRAEAGLTKQILRREGRDVVVATSRSPVRDRLGNVAGFVGVLRDVSAEEEASRLKDEFLSTISHELRTPLGYVKGYASTLLLPDGLDDQEVVRRCLRVIVESSDELTELVDNLLDMSKIGAGVLSVSPCASRIGPLIRAAVERAQGRADGHHIAVSMPRGLPRVLADAHRIEQVVFNLLDNAIKYSPPGGCITVSTRDCGERVIVSVADDGPGIPADELEGIFVRFQRGGSALRRRIRGSGLGLAICRGIVEAHHGRIWAESPAAGNRPGPHAGTVVSFSLPVCAQRRHRQPDNAALGPGVSAA